MACDALKTPILVHEPIEDHPDNLGVFCVGNELDLIRFQFVRVCRAEPTLVVDGWKTLHETPIKRVLLDGFIGTIHVPVTGLTVRPVGQSVKAVWGISAWPPALLRERTSRPDAVFR